MKEVKVEIDEFGDRYFECPDCGEINWLAPVDEIGMTVECELCEESFLLIE